MPKKELGASSSGTGASNLWKPVRSMGLSRALMKAGYGTRKQTELMIADGRLSVGGEVVFNPGMKVDAASDIELDGKPLVQLEFSYYVLHKPVRVTCGPMDGSGGRVISDYFPRKVHGLQTVGRLDVKTTGLLLVSNDRVWTNLVTGNQALEQEYRVQVEGVLREIEIGVMTAGVLLPNLGIFRPLSVKIVEIMNGRTVITMVVRQGNIRQVRRMLGTLRHKVVFVRRIRVGDIRLGELPAGGLRHLTRGEIQSIIDAGTPPAGTNHSR